MSGPLLPPHFAHLITNMPPTEITCKCGKRFVAGDVIGKLKEHMDRLNKPCSNKKCRLSYAHSGPCDCRQP